MSFVKKTISSYIICETSLGLQCADEMLKSGHILLGIISPNKGAQNWAKRHNIPYFSTIKLFSESCSHAQCDYLFSIVNNQVLNKEIIALPRYLAINYHDSILPGYAGMHATSWAIINNEKTHGISWHVMSEVIDGGDILKQASFIVAAEDTALSLNLKCYTKAIATFKDLIKELVENTYTLKKQCLKERSYFGYYKQTPNFGFLSTADTAEQIHGLYRALFFGEYPNTFDVFKICINNQILIPSNFAILSSCSQEIPGTIIQITQHELHLSTKTKNISLSGFSDFEGKWYTIDEVIKKLKIRVGDKIQNCNERQTKKLQARLPLLRFYEDFWANQLANTSLVEMPLVSSLPSGETTKQFMITGEKLASIFCFAKIKDYSFVEMFIASFLIYFSRIANTTHFSIGIINSTLMGLRHDFPLVFPDCLPVSFSLAYEQRVNDVLLQVKNRLRLMNDNYAYSRKIYLKHPELKKHSFQDAPVVIDISGVKTETVVDGYHNIRLSVDEETKMYSLNINNTQTKHSNFLLKNFSEHIQNIFKVIVKNSEQKIGEVCFLTEREKQCFATMDVFYSQYSKDTTIHALFEEQVLRSPDSIAIVYEDLSLSYQELNERSNRLANYLRDTYKVRPDSLVAICLDRSEHMLIVILAILKAGGAYVPIDLSYPDERIAYMLEDTKALVVLSNSIYHGRMVRLGARGVLSIDDTKLQAKLLNAKSSNLVPASVSENLAYVIYTSGTTGKPKGVMIEHRGVVNRIKWERHKIG